MGGKVEGGRFNPRVDLSPGDKWAAPYHKVVKKPEASQVGHHERA